MKSFLHGSTFFRAMILAFPGSILLATCSLATNTQAAGSRCAGDDECESGICSRGLCAGASCDCGTTILDTCSSTGTTSTDCQSGWVCAGSLERLYTGGRCLPGCGTLCPDDYQCDGNVCVRPPPPPPTIVARAEPEEAFVGDLVTFTAEATSSNGEIVSYQWAVSDEPGAIVMHTFDQTGQHQVGVTVTDEIGASAAATVSVRVCQPDGSACYYDPSRRQANCCTGSLCTRSESETQATCQPTP